MQRHLSRYQNKPSEEAEHFITPHETGNQQQWGLLLSGASACTANSTKQKLCCCSVFLQADGLNFTQVDRVKVCESPNLCDVPRRPPWWLCWWCGGPGTELRLPAIWGQRPAGWVSPPLWWLSWAHWAAAPSPLHLCPGWWCRYLHRNTWR